jgi:hypothetical protein
MSVVRSQKINSRTKNHVKSRSVASPIYRQSHIVVSHRCYDFSRELEVNTMSPVSSSYRTLAPGPYESEIRGP